VERVQILLGLNFYGNDYTATGGGPVLGHQVARVLEQQAGAVRLQWDDRSKEHFFEYKQVDPVFTMLNKLIDFITLNGASSF